MAGFYPLINFIVYKNIYSLPFKVAYNFSSQQQYTYLEWENGTYMELQDWKIFKENERTLETQRENEIRKQLLYLIVNYRAD